MVSALTRRGSTARWRRLREWVLARDHNICRKVVDGRLCGAYADTVGHIIRREHGGTDDPGNLRAECGPCNYGERPATAPTVTRPSLTQLAIARLLDQVGLPTTTGRRRALDALTGLRPADRFRSTDIDAACRWRRTRGPLTRA